MVFRPNTSSAHPQGGLPLALLLSFLALPNSACQRAGTAHWVLVRAEFQEAKQLFVEAFRQGTQRSRDRTKLLSLDLGSGARTGEYERSSRLAVLGQGPGRICYHDYDPGLSQVRKFSIDLPGLLAVQDLGQTGACPAPGPETHRCPFQPDLPRSVGDLLLLDAASICDGSNGDFITFEGGDRLVSWQSLEGKPGKLRIGRLTPAGKLSWRLEEEALEGNRERIAPGYRLAWASALAGDLVLVLQLSDHAGSGDMWILRLQSSTGQLRWKYRLHG